MTYRFLGFVSALALAITVGCAQESTPVDPLGEDRVATVDGEPVQAALFNFYSVGRLQKESEFLTDEEYDALLNELVEFRLLAGAAESEGLLQTPELAAQLEVQRLQTLARAMASSFLENNPVTEAELQLAYQQNLDAIAGPQYKARHILVDTEEDAVAVIAELDGGGDFQELARARSTGPSAPSGGDLGWFAAETMVAPFADAVRNMDVGTYTPEPVATRFGWHVILLEDFSEREAPGLDAVRTEMTSFVEQRKVAEFLSELREAAQVTIGEDAPEG